MVGINDGTNGLAFIFGRGWNIAVGFGAAVGTNSWLFIFNDLPFWDS